MAAANSDQENVLLSSDDGSPSTPPPARRLPFKAAVAVGLCVFAAGLAGAVMMGRPAARAPAKIWHRWSATGLHEDTMPVYEFKHITKECVELLEALEKEAEEEGRTHQTDSYYGGTLDCKEESEQACTFDYSMYNMSINEGKCFPAVCKEANIFKELEAMMDEVPEDAELSGLKVSCVSSGEDEGSTTREPWAQYLSEECHDGLVELEKEAEKNGRKHWKLENEAEDLDCKESEQTCTVSFSQMGESFEVAKCFPADCKQQNIFKGIEEVTSDAPSQYAFTGLKVSCSGESRKGKGRK